MLDKIENAKKWIENKTKEYEIEKKLEKSKDLIEEIIKEIDIETKLNKTTNFIEEMWSVSKNKFNDLFDVYENVSSINKKVDDNILNIINELQKESYFYKKLLDSNINISRDKIKYFENKMIDLKLKELELSRGNSKVEVAIIGNFSSGKSTFINSFLGDEVCPMDVNPTTSSVTKFYFSSKEEVFVDKKSISKKEYHQMARHKKNIVAKSTKTYFFEYGYPSIAFSNIILYDTPGFGNSSSSQDEKETLSLLEQVDAVLYIIDVNKGTISKEELNRLEKYKDKAMFCIINKADLKSPVEVEKVKKEIENKKIFQKVIAYSSSKILEELKDNKLNQLFTDIQKQYIPNQTDFNITIKGIKKESKRKNKKTIYNLSVTNGEKIESIDISYTNSSLKRDEILDVLNSIASQKDKILKKSLKIENKKLKDEINNFFSLVLEELDENPDTMITNNFQRSIDLTLIQLNQFEESRHKSLKNSIIKAFKNSISAVSVSKSEKDYWFDPYYKIRFSRDSFFNEFLLDWNKFLEDYSQQVSNINSFLQNKYNFEISIIQIDEEKKELNELFMKDILIHWYKKLGDFHRNSSGEIVYYNGKEDAVRIIDRTIKPDINNLIQNSFNKKNSLSRKLYLSNKSAIEQKIRALNSEISLQVNDIKQIKQEIQNYLKGKK